MAANEFAIKGDICRHKSYDNRFELTAGIIGWQGKHLTSYDVWTLRDTPQASPAKTAEPDSKPVAKPAKTYMLKAYCKHSGYTVRLTNKWIEKHGPPICPCCQTVMTV